MAQTKPKAAQFYGVSGDGTAGQVLISDGNGGMSWGANTEQFTVSWNTPTGQSLTYTQPNPQSSQGAAGSGFPTTTFTATKSGEEISGTATIAGLPTGITATQSLSGTGADNILTVTLTGTFPGADSLNTALTLSGLTVVVPIPPLTVDYLVVAGGGGGGGVGGGGGAGGYRTNYLGTSLTLVSGTNYTVTIGAGGGPSATYDSYGHDGAVGANGSNSVFSTITSAGGGGGSGASNAAGSGGSGGGARYVSGGYGNTPSTTPSQGNNGGSASTAGLSNAMGGGGGGANQAGNTTLNNGGNGSVNSITGSNVTYSGGGGGGGCTACAGAPNIGLGGSGGGAGGGANAGTVNTGGGGGGGTWTNNSNITTQRGGAGGSGLVILRYPNNYTISGLSGTTTPVGSDKVTTFTNTGTGTIQFNL